MISVSGIREQAADWYERHGNRIRPFVNRKLLEKGIGFIRRTGLKVVDLERGRAVLRMPPGPNKNHIGTMYAGALFTLAEVPGGALFLSSFDTKNYYPIVTEMSIRFLKPAKGPISVELTMPDAEIERLQAEASANGKAAFTLEAELKDESGEVVATSRGEYQLRAR